MDELTSKKCQALPKGSPALDTDRVDALVALLRNPWQVSDDCKTISFEYRFKNYYHTIAFVNALAWVAHQEDHHPDLLVSYNKCTVSYSTHSVGGLSENDFICAAKIDALYFDD